MTPLDVLKERMFTGIRDSKVAEAAGIAASLWASASQPRVFYEDTGFIGARNRGRLPFVEFWIGNQSFNREWDIGGTISTDMLVRAWTGGRNPESSAELSYDILTAAAMSIRNVGGDNLMMQGGVDSITAMVKGPWGHSQDMTMSVDITFDTCDYGRT